MLPILVVIIVLGVILETLSLRRDPDMIELDYAMSARVTEPGAPLKVQAVISNKSRIPVSYLAVREIFPLAAEIPEDMLFQMKNDGLYIENVCRIRGRQRKRLILDTSIKKRGVHSFKGDSIAMGDFLGFREISKRVSTRHEIVVYPEKLEYPHLADALASFFGDIAARRYLIRDPIITAGCREYTGREPMKDIHWLQSARRGELMVREFEHNRQLSVNVILSVNEIDPSDSEGLDECCTVARSICESLLSRGAPVVFFTNALLQKREDRAIWKCDVFPEHTGGLLEGLGRVSFRSCCSLDKLLEYAFRESSSDAAFIVIVPADEKHGEESVNRLRGITNQEVLLVKCPLMEVAM